MSPILVRPVREQLEHDRIIRQLQTKLKRRYDSSINPGAEQNAPVKVGTNAIFPDLLLFSQERGRRLQAVVEVETGESVNHLEALAQWAHFGRLRVGFFLYVPAGMVDVARRLCEDNHIQVTVVGVQGDKVRLGITAPDSVLVDREEVHRRRGEFGGPRPLLVSRSNSILTDD